MTIAYMVFVLGIAVVVGGGVIVYARTPTNAGWCQNALGRLGRVRDSSVTELGRYVGALAVLLAMSGVAVIVSWLFGRLVRRFERHIDYPFYRWTVRHLDPTGSWHHLNSVVTGVGDVPPTKALCLAAAIFFVVAWRRRGFWIPPIIMATTFGLEKFSQKALALVVNRGHPPGTLGTFPSGGVARVLCTFGMIFCLTLLTWPSISRRWRVAGWTAVGLLAFVEGYTRIIVYKHWVTDVVGGFVYGTLLLLALVAAAFCLAPGSRSPESHEASGERQANDSRTNGTATVDRAGIQK